MLLKRMELIGAAGLKANNILTFIYTPTSPYQLILGTNGSGKSSILKELTPLPGLRENFIKAGGSKITEWEHKNNSYTLSSVFKGTAGKHSFIKNGEELNLGGTGVVQKELVETEFGITFELHRFLTHEIRFTDLDPRKKREMLTMISDTDFTFAIELYGRLSQAMRHTVGAYKHLTGRVSQETDQLLALDTGDDYEALAGQVREELNALFSNRGVETVRAPDLDRALERVQQLAEALVRNRPIHPPGMHVTCYEDIIEAVQQADRDVVVAEATLKLLSEQYHDLEELVRTLEAAGADGVETLRLKLAQLEQERRACGVASGNYPVQLNAAGILEASNDAIPQLVEIFTLLPDNSDRKYSGPKLMEARERLAALGLEVDRAVNRQTQAEVALEHMHDATKVNCPNCKHVWIPGYSETRRDGFEAQREEALKAAESARKQRGEVEQYIETATEYAALYARYSKGLVRSYPKLSTLWDYILNNEAATCQPSTWIVKFYAWLRDVELWARQQQLDAQIEELTHALETAQRLEGTTQLSLRMERLQADIEHGTTDLTQKRVRCTQLGRHGQAVLKYLASYDEFISAEHSVTQALELNVEALRQQCINEAIEHQHTRLSALQSKLQSKRSLEAIVEDLKFSRAEVEQDLEAYKFLVQELSPTEGLIAEQLQGFIEAFTGHINSIISRVWTYDLELLPCGSGSGELDYVFPLNVRNDFTVVNSAKWSAGQTDIVNFAFVMVLVFYLKLQHLPLLLDELGASFDPEHRHTVMNFVKSLLETGGFDQVFMVSHYASSHGAFNNAEVLVMDAQNIVVPDVYNKHVLFG